MWVWISASIFFRSFSPVIFRLSRRARFLANSSFRFACAASVRFKDRQCPRDAVCPTARSRDVCCKRSETLGFSLLSRSNLTNSSRPRLTATWRGLRPTASGGFSQPSTWAPKSVSAWPTSMCPTSAASCRGGHPSSIGVLGSMPRAMQLRACSRSLFSIAEASENSSKITFFGGMYGGDSYA